MVSREEVTPGAEGIETSTGRYFGPRIPGYIIYFARGVAFDPPVRTGPCKSGVVKNICESSRQGIIFKSYSK